MTAKLHAFFDRYADPEYDIRKGGRSKCRRLVPDESIAEGPAQE